MLTKRFTVSYAGEVEYDIIDEQHRIVAKVAARFWGNSKAPWNGDYWETGIKKQIGTVRYYSCNQWHGPPTPEIMALFPGMVGVSLSFHDRGGRLEIWRHEPNELPITRVCDVDRQPIPYAHGDHVANARLIAAAPELLAACQMIVRADEYSPDPRVIDAIELARAAIAKATGTNT